MTGYKITLQGVSFSDPSFPVLLDDPALRAGSLYLVDMTHSLQEIGVPADGAMLTNLAWKQALAAIGSGTKTSLSTAVVNKGMSGSTGKVERTPKGGLHVINSKSVAVGKNIGATSTTGLLAGAAYQFGFAAPLPQAILDYIKANPTHDMYMSLWWTETRNPNYPGPTYGEIAGLRGNGTDTSDAMASLNWMTGGANAAGSLGGLRNSTFATSDYGTATSGGEPTGPQARLNMLSYRNIGWKGVAPSLIADEPFFAFVLGNFSRINRASSTMGVHPSGVWYRTYIEDRTVSGRTYAQCDASDLALHAIWSASGGKMYGDTLPTAPSTIP